MPRHDYPPEFDAAYCENCENEDCAGCDGKPKFDCVVDGGHFTDSIGLFDTEQEATDAGNDWVTAQCFTGEDWVTDDSDPLGGYWADDDAPSFEVVPD